MVKTRQGIEANKQPSYRLGIDIGSTTLKVCLLTDAQEQVEAVASIVRYRRHHANPSAVAAAIMRELREAIGEVSLRVCMTGSVGMGYAERLHLPFVQEVIAASEVIKRQYPDVRTFVDMGGEDSKMIFFEEGRVPDMRMNGNCAGGTGSFIDQTATLLGVETAELNTLAAQSKTIYPMASRCGVFSKTDIQNLLARNVQKEDIAASMFRAVSMQVVSALARGMDIQPQVFFCGGPFAYLPELKKHLQEVMHLTDDQCVMPMEPQFVPATGCALLADGEAMPISRLLDLFEQPAEEVNSSQKRANNTALDPLFASEEEYAAWCQKKSGHAVPTAPLDSRRPQAYFLGVDSGSTTTKVIVLNETGAVVYSDYSFNNGDSLQAFTAALERLYASVEHPENVQLKASAATGYGENLLKAAFSLDYGIVETMAHFMAAHSLDPEVSFVMDIGGQDMKAIYASHGSIHRIEINEACSSGCGSFIMTFANQLGYSIGDFARMACYGRHPYDLGTRCTVFMNSKVKQAMREGATVEDIAAGFSYSVIKNCLFKVLKMKSTDEMGKHIVVQGGTMKNHSVVRALERLTGVEVTFSDMPEMMGALGAALYARAHHKE